MRKTPMHILAAGILLAALSGPASAVPIVGATLTADLGIEANGNPFLVQDTVTFTAGTTATGLAGIATIDVTASQIVLGGMNISFNTACCDFNGYRIYDTAGVIDDFDSVTLDSTLTTVPALPILSFTGDEIRLNWAGTASGFAVGNIVLNIGTRTSVPEPSTLLLLGAALLAFGVGRRLSGQRSS